MILVLLPKDDSKTAHPTSWRFPRRPGSWPMKSALGCVLEVVLVPCTMAFQGRRVLVSHIAGRLWKAILRVLKESPATVCMFELLLVVSPSLQAGTAAKEQKTPEFLYDRADQTIPATMFEGSEYHDPSVAGDEEGLWIAWLEFVPGQGDQLWVGRCQGAEWEVKKRVSDQPGEYARPTLTVDAGGRLWLSYEALRRDNGQWDIFIRQRRSDGHYTRPQRVSPGAGTDINHHVAADPHGGIWIVWQADCGGQFDVIARRVEATDSEQPGEPHVISNSPLGDWHPALAVTAEGDVCVVWDSYDGESFNVLSRRLIGNQWKAITAVAAGPAFEGRAQVVCDRKGRTWVSWEEGGLNWGKPYRRQPPLQPGGMPNILKDLRGPLHRFRKLHVALLGENGMVQHLAQPLPMPSLDKALELEDRRKGANELGVSYERTLLTVDECDRLWVVYRHFYLPRLSQSESLVHHIEQGWQLFARCLERDGWSKLYAFDVYQRDGMQRLSIAPQAGGLVAAWNTGRTDRRGESKRRGMALGSVSHPESGASQPGLLPAQPAGRVVVPSKPATRLEPANVGGRTFHLYTGDLHRHTDLSLCQPFVDGSVDDAYRYAIEVVRHDFLAITDHACDLARGNRQGQVWWRCTKEVDRHRLTGTFFPFFGYEKSFPGTDHNVISLRADILREFNMPMAKFWKELDHDAITIPHVYFGGNVWSYQDDAKRPLLEIYQGARNLSSERAAHAALREGHHLGFISSSDHCSTASSFACVWAPEPSRESIFRSMQTRRTYGATDKIRLIFRSGDHWMGEQFAAHSPPQFQIEIDGTAPLEQVEVVQDGKPFKSLSVPSGATSLRATYSPSANLIGKHYLYIHLRQADGNQAWSSPIWVDVVPEGG